jgi:hypothetical protein
MMATRGRGAPEEVGIEVGNVAEGVILSAHCPVFVWTVAGFGRKPPLPKDDAPAAPPE